MGRLIRETDDRFSFDISFRYDKRGNKTHVLRDGIIQEVYTYWGEGYLYNSGGQKSRVVRQTGKVREFEYDDMDRLARVSCPFSDEILLKSCRERLDAGLFPQQRSPGGDSFIHNTC